jgi:hypothetical protein
MAKKGLPPEVEVALNTPEVESWIRQFEKYGIPRRAGKPLVLMLGVVTGMAGAPEPGRFPLNQVRAELRFLVDLLHAELPRTPLPRTLEPTVTPEETLRAAGISNRRQARYQRRVSSLLAGRS